HHNQMGRYPTMTTATRFFGLNDFLSQLIERFTKSKDQITERDVQRAVRKALQAQDTLQKLTSFGERVETARQHLNGPAWTTSHGKDAFLRHVYGGVPSYQWFLLEIDENPTADDWQSIANQIWPDGNNMPMQMWSDDGSPQCGALEIEGRTRINGCVQLRVRGARQVVTEVRIGSKVLPLFGAGWTELWSNSSWEPNTPFLRFDDLYEHDLPYASFAEEVGHHEKTLRALQYGPSADE
ncbi:hypothetical protein N8083_01400, partial [Candidatus Pacebacteria bacterium]|nr:hypothetical protein [Candidatus Paceibacterota bacterium]